MVKSSYIPNEGDIVWIDFTPQAGHEQAGRRPGFVVSPKSYNQIGLALLCPITNAKKGYPFEVVISGFGGNTSGVVLADHIRSMDWRARNAEFKESVDQSVLLEVKNKIALVLQL